MSRRSLTLVLIFSVFCLNSAAGVAADVPTAVETALKASPHHQAEAEAKILQWQEAQTRGFKAQKSWAPDPSPSPIDVLEYDIRLYLDTQREVASGTVEIRLAAAENGLQTVELDAAAGLRVLSATLLEDGTLIYDSPLNLTFDHSEDILSIQLNRALASGEEVVLEVAYGGRANDNGMGINWNRGGSGRSLISTFAEPFGARVWFPCNDRPDDKAIVAMWITAPAVLTVTSNGLLEDRTEHEDGTATTQWASIYPVPTYLVVMNAHDFDVSQETYVSDSGATMPVMLYALPEVAEQAKIDLAFTPEAIAVFADSYGEYPFIEEKYGNCTTYFGGGMEHQTLTTISAGAVGDAWMEWLNVHELAHQWWGDWVTCADWRELWLNEGFATFSEWIWAESKGDDDLQDYLSETDGTGQFFGPVYDNPTPFSGTVYRKGAWVLRMLRQFMGDDDFFAGVLNYRENFAGDAATTEELRSVFEETSGLDLEWFFDQWVYGENRPSLHYSWQATDGPTLQLTITQKQTNAGLFRMPLDVRVTTATGTEDHRVEILAEAEQVIDIPLSTPATAVELDPDNWALFQLHHADDPDIDFGPDFPTGFDAGVGRIGENKPITIPVSNLGGEPLEIAEWGATQGSSDFSIVSPESYPITINPGETVNFEVNFIAKGLGLRSNWLWFYSNDPERENVSLVSVSGWGAFLEGVSLQVQGSVNAGSVPIFSVGEKTFDFANMGNEPMTVTAHIEGDAFALGSVIPETVTPGTWTQVRIRFSPETVGDHEGMLTLRTNDPARPVAEINLRGEGLSAPHIEIDPGALAFGIASAGDTASLRLSSTGTQDLEIYEVHVHGPFEHGDGWMGAVTVPQGTSVEFPVELGSDASGAARGAVRILSNDPGLPWATAPLSAVADAETAANVAIPASASTAGLGGAWWSTDVIFLNPGDSDLATDLFFHPSGVRGENMVERTVTVPANAQRTLADTVAELGHTGAGGLTLAATGDLVVTTRTAATDGAGSYGQTIAGVPMTMAQQGGVKYLLPGLASGGGFHTNLGVLNLGDEALTLTFFIFSSDGTPLGTTTLTALPGAFAQDVDALADLDDGDLRGAWAEVSCDNADSLFTTYASVVDDASHDPTFIPPTALDNASEFLLVPVAAANPGLAGTRWVTELTVVNLGDEAATATVRFYPADSSAASSAERTIEAGSSFYTADVIRDVFSLDNVTGSITVEATTPVHAGCRIFNNSNGGTYGQHVPVLTASGAANPGTDMTLPGLRSHGGFRTNVGLTSFADVDGSVEVAFYEEGGAHLGTETVNLPAGAFVQIVEALRTLFDYEGAAFATIDTTEAGGPVAVHASVVDGSTGDPSYIAAGATVTMAR